VTKPRKGEKADPVVKTEEGSEPALSKKGRRGHKTPSNELHIYSAAELSRLNQRELLADVQLLDGLLILLIYPQRLIFFCITRAIEEE
jgi:hypothetical protein